MQWSMGFLMFYRNVRDYGYEAFIVCKEDS